MNPCSRGKCAYIAGMETTNIQSPAAMPVSVASAAASTPVPSMPNTSATTAPIRPALSRGHKSSEFYLALVVVATIVAALWAGKLDPALASALLGLIVSGYPTLRTWLKAQHVDAVADVLAAQIRNGGGAVALGALAQAVGGAGVVGPAAQREQKTAGTAASTTLAPLALLGAMLLILNGCAAGTPVLMSRASMARWIRARMVRGSPVVESRSRSRRIPLTPCPRSRAWRSNCAAE